MKDLLKIVNILLVISIFIINILIFRRIDSKKSENYMKVGFDIYTKGESGQWGQPYVDNNGNSGTGTGNVSDCNSKVGNSMYYCDAPVCSGGNLCDPTVDGDICPTGSVSAIVSDLNNPGGSRKLQ